MPMTPEEREKKQKEYADKWMPLLQEIVVVEEALYVMGMCFALMFDFGVDEDFIVEMVLKCKQARLDEAKDANQN